MKDHIRSNLWFAPALATVLALTAAYVAVRFDQHATRDTLLFDGGPDSARELLSTIASSMLTFTALVFSITIVALQLASNQFSPRVIRTFLHERVTKLAMATFVGTFVYAVAVLSTVRSGDDPFVPAVATWLALTMVLACVGMFIQYVHRMAHSVRAITVITKIASETRRSIDRMCLAGEQAVPSETAEMTRGEPDAVIRHDDDPGVLTFIDIAQLVEIASSPDAYIEVVPRVGDFLPVGAELFRVWGSLDEDRCRAALAFDIERTPEQDPAFGFRQLVDMAVRAVSPGINDPSTAVQALDHIHDLLRRLTVRELPRDQHCDADGVVRVTLRTRTYAEFVQLAFEEIRDYGASSVQVRRRIKVALEDCLAAAPRARRGVLEAELLRLDLAPPVEPRDRRAASRDVPGTAAARH